MALGLVAVRSLPDVRRVRSDEKCSNVSNVAPDPGSCTRETFAAAQQGRSFFRYTQQRKARTPDDRVRFLRASPRCREHVVRGFSQIARPRASAAASVPEIRDAERVSRRVRTPARLPDRE